MLVFAQAANARLHGKVPLRNRNGRIGVRNFQGSFVSLLIRFIIVVRMNLRVLEGHHPRGTTLPRGSLKKAASWGGRISEGFPGSDPMLVTL